MEIRDIIHGTIFVQSNELPILDSKHFQRLRQIRQLGFAEYSFPGATHNRYIHSLGAMETATQAFDAIFLKYPNKHQLIHYRQILRIAALLHDIGHGPLSHSTEFAMPRLQELRPNAKFGGPSKSRKATHEDYTLKIIMESSLSPLIDKLGKEFGFNARHVASLIDPDLSIGSSDGFFDEKVEGQKVHFRPLLHQMVSSELDADRMDYLRRDSLQAGVSYGQFDFHWLVKNLTFHIQDGKVYLALQHRALYAFEDFLISRFHMFLMVYFHFKSVVYDEMLAQYFNSPDCDYALPTDIEEYALHNDSFLYTHLSKSKNPWAERISQRKPFRVLIELHSGIPSTKTAFLEHQRLLGRIEKELNSQKILYLLKTSTGGLSKYFRKLGNPIFVKYDNQYHSPSFIRLEQCTDLFQRYEENRSITRIYVAPEDYPKIKRQRHRTHHPYLSGLPVWRTQ